MFSTIEIIRWDGIGIGRIEGTGTGSGKGGDDLTPVSLAARWPGLVSQYPC